MISDRNDTEAYYYLLQSFNERAIRVAGDMLEGRLQKRVDGVPQESLLSACRAVWLDRGLMPAFFMIDGCDSERLAIERVFPGIPLRACQFHVMQACRSKARKVYHRFDNCKWLANAFMQAVRRCQRCPSALQWPSFYARLQVEIEEHNDRGKNVWEVFANYLNRSWFSPSWLPYVVDYGIPRHVTRDGPWSTNNYSEAAFRTFDRVFLRCQANRRSVSRRPIVLPLTMT